MIHATLSIRSKEDISVKQYYHGSDRELPVGTIMRGGLSDGYAARIAEASDIYRRLEWLRPTTCIAHKDAIFMASGDASNEYGLDDIDALGGSTDYVFALRPNAPVQRYDQSLITIAECALSDGKHQDEIDAILASYWRGQSSGAPLWEYLTTSAVVASVQDFETSRPKPIDNGTFILSNMDAEIPEAKNEGGYCIASVKDGSIKALGCVKGNALTIVKGGSEAVSKNDEVVFNNIDDFRSPYKKLALETNAGKRTARISSVIGTALPYSRRYCLIEFKNARGQISQHEPEIPTSFLHKADAGSAVGDVRAFFENRFKRERVKAVRHPAP